MGTVLYGTDAACMALLAISADNWENTPRAKAADTAVMIIQVVTLAGKRRVVEKRLARHRKSIWGQSSVMFLSRTVDCTKARARWQP